MLKYVIFSLLISTAAGSWAGVIFLLFLGSFIFCFICPVGGMLGRLSISLGVD